MKKRFDIVSKISKNGRAKAFSLVLLALLLVFSVYSVFGNGISGAAVVGSGEPYGAVVNPDGGSYWEKSGAGRIEWDKHVTQFCSGVRYANVTSYLATNDLDVCLSTNSPLSKGSKAYVWRNISHTISESYYLNNSYELWLGNESRFILVENGSYYTVDSEDWFFDWFDITDKFSYYSHGGKNYYCIKDMAMVQNNKYSMKFDFAFPIKQIGDKWGCDEKFGIFAKRSADSLGDALSSGNYIELDPSFLADYQYRVNVSFTTNGYIPSGAVIPFNVGTDTWNIGGDAYIIYDNLNNVALEMMNVSSEGNASINGNNTGNLVRTVQAYEPNTAYNNVWSFYFGGNYTSPPTFNDLYWVLYPVEGSGNPSLYTGLANSVPGAKYPMPMTNITSGNSIDWIQRSIYGNYTLNFTASDSGSNMGLNCTDAYRDGAFKHSYGTGAGITFDFAVNASQQPTGRWYNILQLKGLSGVSGIYHVSLGYEGSSGDGDDVHVNMRHPDPGDYFWRQTETTNSPWDRLFTGLHVIATSNNSDNQMFYDDGQVVASLDTNVPISSEWNYTDGSDCAFGYDTYHISDPSWSGQLMGSIDFMASWVGYKPNITYKSPPVFTFGSIEGDNTFPSIQNDQVTISPSPAQDSSDLSCTFTPLDGEQTSLTAYVDWYNNSGVGGIIAVQNEMPVANGTSTSFTLDNGNTTVNEYWNCSVRISDGSAYSDWVNSTSTQITTSSSSTDPRFYFNSSVSINQRLYVDGAFPTVIFSSNTTDEECNSTFKGAIIFSEDRHYGCDGTNWHALY